MRSRHYDFAILTANHGPNTLQDPSADLATKTSAERTLAAKTYCAQRYNGSYIFPLEGVWTIAHISSRLKSEARSSATLLRPLPFWRCRRLQLGGGSQVLSKRL